MHARRFAIMVGVVVSAATTRGNAQQANPDPRAERFFNQGRAKATAGDCAGAIPFYRRSLALYEGRGALVNLAQCLEQTGHLMESRETYARVLPRLEKRDERVALVTVALESLEKRVPMLTLVGEDVPAGTTIRVGRGEAIPLGALLVLRLDPGAHNLAIVAPGRQGVSFAIDLSEGARVTKAFRIPPAWGVSEGAFASDEESGPSTTPWRTLGWIGTGAGAAALLGGAIAGGLAASTQNELDAECPNPKRCSEDGLDMASMGETLTTTSTVLFVGGALVAATGVGLVIWSSSEKSEAQVSAGAGWVRWVGRF